MMKLTYLFYITYCIWSEYSQTWLFDGLIFTYFGRNKGLFYQVFSFLFLVW